MYGLGKEDLNSAELSTVRTNGSEKSREKPRRGPFTLTPIDPHPKLFGYRDSSPPSDLEAQTHVDPKKFEENLKTLQMLNNRLLEEPQNRVIPQRSQSRRKWPGNSSNNASSKKIAESLHKAYNVSSYTPRQLSQTSDYPLSPKSKPIPRHLRRSDPTGASVDPQQRRVSKTRSENIQSRKSRTSQQSEELPRTKARQDSGKSFSLPPDFLPQPIKVPPPIAPVEHRSSSKGRVDSFERHDPISFFSTTSTKSRNSRASSTGQSGTTSKRASTVPSIPPLRLPSTTIAPPPALKVPALKVPPPTPATTTSSLEKEQNPDLVEVPKPLKPSPTKIRFEAGTKSESTKPRPPDIDIEAANAKRRTSVLVDNHDQPTRVSPVSPETEGAPRGQSARSTRSFATFASSDLSSAWTYGKAQPMPIFPSVAPRAVGLETGNTITPLRTPLRPKSKYGRTVKASGMKALPVLPTSSLNQREAV
ncbi:MAG: hypothetical protein Q9168_007837 [Polycauliona sp. 1 TL-2023]